jgi:hypothetical protein
VISTAVLALAVAATPGARRWLAGPPAPAAAVLSVSDRTTGCSWRLLRDLSLEARPAGSVARNGLYQGQAAGLVEGRAVWYQRSDWNQLFIPLDAPLPDVFSVQAEFRSPPADGHAHDVRFMIFTDPGGPDASDVAHGRGIVLRAEPGRPPVFEWGRTDGLHAREVTYKGVLPAPFSGAWRTLQVEGSRSGCWLRVLLDGAPILAATGECDLVGRHLMLGAAAAPWRAANVAWSAVRVFSGGDDCR